MKFWDASAIVPLLFPEASSVAWERRFVQDAEMVVWWGSCTECAAALCRKSRESRVPEADLNLSMSRLLELSRRWMEVLPAPSVRVESERLLRSHSLRAADALQLGAALVACGGVTQRLPFLCGDERLAVAAEREGFVVIR